MRSNRVFILTLVLTSSSMVFSQTVKFEERSDGELMAFMKRQLAADLPIGRFSVDGFDIEPNIEILRLVRSKDWALEMIFEVDPIG